MSNLTLTNYTIFNDYGTSYYLFYVHPPFTVFAAFQSLICSIVLASKELQKSGAFFQYSLVQSVGTVVAMFFLTFLFMSKCNRLCSISTLYISQLYQVYMINYFQYSLFIAAALMQIVICLQLYLSIKRKYQKLISRYPFKICALLTSNFLIFFVYK